MTKHTKVVLSGVMTASQYTVLHKWVRTNAAKATACTNCGKTDSRLQWANVSGGYKKDLLDFIALCPACHRRMDNSGDPNACINGHPMTLANTYNYPNGKYKQCRTCRQTLHKVSKAKEKIRIAELTQKPAEETEGQ